MSHFYRKKLNAQGRYINPPVHATLKKDKKISVTGMTDSPVMKYKFERGPLKETSAERTIRIAKEAEERYYARQAEKEAGRMFKRKTAEEKRVIAEAKRKAKYAVKKKSSLPTSPIRKQRKMKRQNGRKQRTIRSPLVKSVGQKSERCEDCKKKIVPSVVLQRERTNALTQRNG